jgi:hypothetical protein
MRCAIEPHIHVCSPRTTCSHHHSTLTVSSQTSSIRHINSFLPCLHHQHHHNHRSASPMSSVGDLFLPTTIVSIIITDSIDTYAQHTPSLPSLARSAESHHVSAPWLACNAIAVVVECIARLAQSESSSPTVVVLVSHGDTLQVQKPCCCPCIPSDSRGGVGTPSCDMLLHWVPRSCIVFCTAVHCPCATPQLITNTIDTDTTRRNHRHQQQHQHYVSLTQSPPTPPPLASTTKMTAIYQHHHSTPPPPPLLPPAPPPPPTCTTHHHSPLTSTAPSRTPPQILQSCWLGMDPRLHRSLEPLLTCVPRPMPPDFIGAAPLEEPAP